jgi:hypothetical protein
MSIGLGMEIVSVLIVIRLHTLVKVSLPFYACFVFVSFMVPFLADLELPDAIQVFEKTDRILGKWNIGSTGCRRNRGYYRRQIRSLRSCSLYAGFWDLRLYPLRMNTKTTHYSLMVAYVISALISVPESHFNIDVLLLHS